MTTDGAWAHHWSQTHRMAEVGRTSTGHQDQALLKQGHPELAAQDHVQVAFEYLQQTNSPSTCGSENPLRPVELWPCEPAMAVRTASNAKGVPA